MKLNVKILFSRSPDMCEGLNETGIEYHAKMQAHKPSPHYPTYFCRSHPVIKVDYHFNPKLTVWLSLVCTEFIIFMFRDWITILQRFSDLNF